MSKILIVGNSIAVIKAIEQIRQNDQDSEVVLFCTESVLPYDRELLPSLVSGEIKESHTHPLVQNFFKQHNVQVISNEKLLRISLKRKYLTTESKQQIDFDRLMVADLGSLSPIQIKGSQKKGVFDCSMLTSVKQLMKYLPFTDTVFVMVSRMQGFNIACALHGLGKEVVIVASGPSLLSDVLDDETGSLLKQIIESKGIRVVTDNKIEEILGDSDMKALRLQTEKVIAAQMLVVDSLPLDWRILEQDEGWEKIEDNYFTDQLPIKPSHFGLKVLNGYCMGITKLPQGGREYLKFDGPQNVFKKIYAQGDVLVGTVLFNAASHEKHLSKAILEQAMITGHEEDLLGG